MANHGRVGEEEAMMGRSVRRRKREPWKGAYVDRRDNGEAVQRSDRNDGLAGAWRPPQNSRGLGVT